MIEAVDVGGGSGITVGVAAALRQLQDKTAPKKLNGKHFL